MTSDFHNPLAEKLAAKLVKESGMISSYGSCEMKCGRVFYVNSGAEANEHAIKLALYNKSGYGMSFIDSFHGRTLTALSHSTSKSVHRKRFHVNNNILIPFFGSVNSCFRYIEDVVFKKIADPSEISYLMTEPIQIEAGVITPMNGFHEKLERLCRCNDIQLIWDDVQCGMGRIGSIFSNNVFNITPDVITFGKAVASGLPLSGVISDSMYWEVGSNASTFGGNIVSCASALETIEVIKELLPNVSRLERIIKEYLQDIDHLISYESMGLIWKIEFESKELSEYIRMELFKKHIMMIPCGNKALRIEPPLSFSVEDMIKVMEIVVDVVRKNVK